MEVIELISRMQDTCERLRQAGKRIRFIPTMGALHSGHASLIEAATREPLPVKKGLEEKEDEEDTENNNNFDLNPSQCSINEKNGKVNTQSPVIIVSIFANPMQFDQIEDYEKYPKTYEADLELCRRLNVDYVFMPYSEEIYCTLKGMMSNKDTHSQQDGIACCIVEPPTELNNDLEGKSRRGHFRGVLTIVCKLFNIIRPHEAYFGEKDYQQMVLVRMMVRDLNMNTNIRSIATVRDIDMLPLSSRNIRMNEQERRAAPFMYKILSDTKPILESLDNNSIHLKQIDEILLASLITIRALASENYFELVHVDYLQLRCSRDFTKIHFRDHHPQLKYFDCQNCCVRNQIRNDQGLKLQTRLLISCLVGKNGTGVRLLDNIEVKLNNNSV